MPRRSELVATALTMEGTPFRHQGRTPGVALDCAGLIRQAAAAHGIELEDVAGYAPNPDGRSLVEHLDRILIETPVSALKPADVVVMFFEQSPTHLAMIVNDDPWTIVHAHRQRGRVVTHRLDRRSNTALRPANLLLSWRRGICKAPSSVCLCCLGSIGHLWVLARTCPGVPSRRSIYLRPRI